MIKDKLKNLIQENTILYTIIVDLNSNAIEEIGDKNKLEYSGLLNTLFGDKESIFRLNNSLKNQIMPQSWGQGKVSCIVCKPVEDILIGLFYHNEKDGLEAYNFDLEINKEIEKIWNE